MKPKDTLICITKKAFGLSDPLLTLRDPWNRSIRPWIYYTEDNPTMASS